MGGEGNVVGNAIDLGVVDAMIDAFEHDSPFCVAAAAACLGFVARASGNRGQALIEASGAIHELIRILERAPKAGDPKDYPKYVNNPRDLFGCLTVTHAMMCQGE
jgi:hypothetical protein